MAEATEGLIDFAAFGVEKAGGVAYEAAAVVGDTAADITRGAVGLAGKIVAAPFTIAKWMSTPGEHGGKLAATAVAAAGIATIHYAPGVGTAVLGAITSPVSAVAVGAAATAVAAPFVYSKVKARVDYHKAIAKQPEISRLRTAAKTERRTARQTKYDGYREGYATWKADRSEGKLLKTAKKYGHEAATWKELPARGKVAVLRARGGAKTAQRLKTRGAERDRAAARSARSRQSHTTSTTRAEKARTAARALPHHRQPQGRWARRRLGLDLGKSP